MAARSMFLFSSLLLSTVAFTPAGTRTSAWSRRASAIKAQDESAEQPQQSSDDAVTMDMDVAAGRSLLGAN